MDNSAGYCDDVTKHREVNSDILEAQYNGTHSFFFEKKPWE